jgi:uncharacterized protein YdeI (YjbR/CyaY-like superfamily)
MRPSGLAEVQAAKTDGRWGAGYQSQRKTTVPGDLADALTASPKAAYGFSALSKTERYAMILKLDTARTATVRAVQLRRVIIALDGRRPYSARGSSGETRRRAVDVARARPERLATLSLIKWVS